MNLKEFLTHRSQTQALKSAQRDLCTNCFNPRLSCYCSTIKAFDPRIKFIILSHLREAKRRIATGRMSHLFLKDSELLRGYDFSNSNRVNELIGDPSLQCMVLYPGEFSLNLSKTNVNHQNFKSDKKLCVFVIDGTWITARKTMKKSKNLSQLPSFCFDPKVASRFRIRKQPEEFCLSTIEAIHECIEYLGPHYGFATQSRTHDRLIQSFESMVDQQIVLASRPQTHCLWSARRKNKGPQGPLST